CSIRSRIGVCCGTVRTRAAIRAATPCRRSLSRACCRIRTTGRSLCSPTSSPRNRGRRLGIGGSMAQPFSGLAMPLDFAPMEARLADAIPAGEGWQYEPRWDGFRCLAFRDGDAVELMSKSGKPLGRYFPEIVAALRDLDERRFVLDGELVLPAGEVLSFSALQLRLQPAASRIEKLSRETPAQLMLFDCLQVGAEEVSGQPLSSRREALEAFMEQGAGPRLLLSPCTV